MMKAYTDIDAYIRDQLPERRRSLRQMRTVIAKAIPEAEERIRYGMPCFHWRVNLLYFASMKQHIGFYPTPSAIAAFRKKLSRYVTSKGAIQFPLDEPLPLDLIRDIALFRMGEEQKRVGKP